ncbi:MAG: hypothetical protein KDB07_04700 [Planctomycetes bacterium]|nr:hypothetical protein [Planctomycetota bacterium]
MALQGVSSSANAAASLLRQPVNIAGNASFSNLGASARAIATQSQQTAIASRQTFLNEASSKTAFLTGIGQIVNAPIGAPEAQLNTRALTTPNPRGVDVAAFLRGVAE